MSGMVDHETESQLQALGGSRFFPKPFHLSELVEALERWANGADTDLLPHGTQTGEVATS